MCQSYLAACCEVVDLDKEGIGATDGAKGDARGKNKGIAFFRGHVK
jgi:hypothetical protein